MKNQSMTCKRLAAVILWAGAIVATASQYPAIAQEPVKLSFEDRENGEVLRDQYSDLGVVFDNAIVRKLNHPVTGPHGIQSADGRNAIVLHFPSRARSVSIQIDADGHNRMRQPRAIAFNLRSEPVDAKNFGQGKSKVELFSPAGQIARVIIGRNWKNHPNQLLASDAYDNSEFVLAN